MRVHLSWLAPVFAWSLLLGCSGPAPPIGAVSPSPIAQPSLPERSHLGGTPTAPARVRRLLLQGSVMAWDAVPDRLVYVPRTGNELRLRQIETQEDRSLLRFRPDQQALQLVWVRDQVAYGLMEVGVSGTPKRYEVGIVALPDGGRRMLDSFEAVREPNGGFIGPRIATDGETVVWSRFAQAGSGSEGAVTAVNTRTWATQQMHVSSDVVFVRATDGSRTIVWRRPFGRHGDPSSLFTYEYSARGERVLAQGPVNISFGRGGVLWWPAEGEKIQVRQELDGPALLSFAYERNSVPVLGLDFVAWCSSEGSVVIVFTRDGNRMSVPVACSNELRAPDHLLLALREDEIFIFDTR